MTSGCSQKQIAFNYKISPEINSAIIAETCEAIYCSLVFPDYTTEYWNGVSDEFIKKGSAKLMDQHFLTTKAIQLFLHANV